MLEAFHANPIVQNITHFNDADEVDLSWRLSTAIYPTLYYVELETKVHEQGNRKYSGVAMIELDLREATNTIILRSKQLRGDYYIRGVVDNLIFYEDATRDFLTIEAETIFEPDSDLILMIEFTGRLLLEGVEFYRSEYKIDGETRYHASKQFGAPHVRYAFPVFDDSYDNLITSVS